MAQHFLPDGGGGGGYQPPVGSKAIHGTPGLLTSTGGLFGFKFRLVMPLFDQTVQRSYLALIDPTNNDTEEEAFYLFKQEDILPARVISVHKLIVMYKELGSAKFSVGVQVYIRKVNKFYQKSVVCAITDRKDVNAPFPDNKLRELAVDLVIEGERPQVFIRRSANSGPISITRVHMIGHADERELL